MPQDWGQEIERLKLLSQNTVEVIENLSKYVKHLEEKIDLLYAFVKSIDDRDSKDM